MLRIPEESGIGKIGVIAKKVGDDGKAACLRVKQGMADRNGLSAKKPLCRPRNYAEHRVPIGFSSRIWPKEARHNIG
ncbi:hypothetical protein [Sphingobium sp. YC-XJ3]|uniref:hypothetical protein n=1 Tax=Sphingobium sp. YC-XJ3 TaxID=3024245 RepID=UPI002360AB50|nr:hypothetical protein [Sphingobium sp. YC-XJ3]WDA38659.1 hypothetical protein PO876_11010 [Sphingobium sp. YC-XJ3]